MPTPPQPLKYQIPPPSERQAKKMALPKKSQPSQSTTQQPQQPQQTPEQTPQQTPEQMQQQLQLQLNVQHHLQQQSLLQKTQKQPEQAGNIDKLIALLTDLSKKYEGIQPSTSRVLPSSSLPPNLNADIAKRGKKIALEAQLAMRAGISGEELKFFILDMLKKERQDIATSSSTTTNKPSAAKAAPSMANTPTIASITSTPTAKNTTIPTPAKDSVSFNYTQIAKPVKIANSAIPKSAELRKELASVRKEFAGSISCQPLIFKANATSTSASTAVTSINEKCSTAKCSTAKCSTAKSTTAKSTTKSTAPTPSAIIPSPATTSPATTSPPTSSLKKSIEISPITGKRRRPLPSFVMSSFLKTKQEIMLPQKKYTKSEGGSSLKKAYPVVEPIEGYDVAIQRMIKNFKNNSSSSSWSISSDEDEDEDEDDE
ncbi:hypothetical protein INT46_006863 [Mucor plumbeus]|uniref:Uncharacterized protein n=1 Tax=Mucor plumbeus TaxID=97098 RepID=A0A8H7RJJ1_9FUNG|nr:hypothetical protein INT46_006863 [Mucor plumbeus]